MPSHRLDILEGGQASLNKLQRINSGLSVSVEKDKGGRGGGGGGGKPVL